MPAPKDIARFYFEGGSRRPRRHVYGCHRNESCGCTDGMSPPPPPAVCCCRVDGEGRRWFNLGCRLHTRLWSPEWTTDRAHRGTALTGAHLPQPSLRRPE